MRNSQQNFEDILQELGGFGNAQFVVAAAKFCGNGVFGWSLMLITQAIIIPDWSCIVYDGGHRNAWTNETDGSNQTAFRTCFINGTACDAYEFIKKPVTMMSEWGLVCDMQWVKATVLSVQMAAVLIGTLLGPQLCDRFGRRKPNALFMLLNIIFNIITPFSTSWQMFAVMRFLLGITIGGSFVTMFPYCLEFIPTKWRPILALQPDWVTGYSLMALSAYFLENWAHMHFLNAAVMAPWLLGFLLVPESIRWLAIHNRIDEAMESCKRIATYNRKPLPPKARWILEGIARDHQQSQKHQKHYTYLDLMKDKHHVKATVIVAADWFAMTIIVYGISFAVSSFSGNFSLNMFLMSISDVPLLLVSFFLMNKMGRRPTTMILLSVSFVAAVGCIIVEVAASPSTKDVVMKCTAIIAKAATMSGWVNIMTWGAELYPTVTRNLGFSAHNMGGRIGEILAPFVIDLDQRPIISFVLVSIFSLLIVISAWALPETKGQDLPDTIVISNKGKKNLTELDIKPLTEFSIGDPPLKTTLATAAEDEKILQEESEEKLLCGHLDV